MLFAACSGRWKSWKTEPRSAHGTALNRDSRAGLRRQARVCRFIEKRRNPIEQLIAAFIDHVGVARIGDFDPVRRGGEGGGEAACFVDRNDGVVGSMEDQGGTGDLLGPSRSAVESESTRPRVCRPGE